MCAIVRRFLAVSRPCVLYSLICSPGAFSPVLALLGGSEMLFRPVSKLLSYTGGRLARCFIFSRFPGGIPLPVVRCFCPFPPVCLPACLFIAFGPSVRFWPFWDAWRPVLVCLFSLSLCARCLLVPCGAFPASPGGFILFPGEMCAGSVPGRFGAFLRVLRLVVYFPSVLAVCSTSGERSTKV